MIMLMFQRHWLPVQNEMQTEVSHVHLQKLKLYQQKTEGKICDSVLVVGEDVQKPQQRALSTKHGDKYI